MRLEDFTMDIDCPQCGHKININMRQVQQAATITCPDCNAAIEFRPTGDDLGRLDRAMRELDETLKELSNIEIRS